MTHGLIGAAIALLADKLRRVLKKIIQKLHLISWLRATFGFPGGVENQSEGNIEMDDLGNKKEDEIIANMEKLIDAAIDIGSESVLKALAEKLNASA